MNIASISGSANTRWSPSGMSLANPLYAGCESGPINPIRPRNISLIGVRTTPRMELKRADNATMPPGDASGPATGHTPPRIASAWTRCGISWPQARAYGPPPESATMPNRFGADVVGHLGDVVGRLAERVVPVIG